MRFLNWRWVFAGVLLYVILLIAYLPAHQVSSRFALPDSINISGVSGTVWHGNIDRLVINNIPVNQLNWSISAWSLLLGQLDLQLEAGNMREASSIAFKGPVSLNILDPLSFAAEEFQLYLPVDRVLAEVQLPLPVAASGRFRVNISQLLFEQGMCEQLSATGDWLNASVAGTQGPIELDTFTAQLHCEAQNYVIEVAEPNAFGLSLTATATADFQTITLDSKFKPDANLPREVHEAAMFFGEPDNQGYRYYSIQ